MFSEPTGTFEICDICGWEDDNVQLQDPQYRGGANKKSLIESQAQILKKNSNTCKNLQRFSQVYKLATNY